MDNQPDGQALFNGKPGPGRPRGSPNRTTAVLRAAILKAADAAHVDGLDGYLLDLAQNHKALFVRALLSKLVPDLAKVEHSGEVGLSVGVGDKLLAASRQAAEARARREQLNGHAG